MMSDPSDQESPPVILYVEDNLTNFQLVRRLLTAEGFVVRGAASRQALFTSLRERTPDIILMDLNMPHDDGYTLTAQIRALEALRYVPIIAVTANVLPSDRSRSLAAGCTDFIQKPIDVDLFPDQLRAHLSSRSKRRAGLAQSAR